ncbi:MAG TPA: LPS assembly protein LptD [Candidatus Deferrimicrobiaceae bacterium]
MRKRIIPAVAILLAMGVSPSIGEETKSPRDAIQSLRKGGGIDLEGPVHLSADTISYDEDAGVAVAEGNVELAVGGRTMKADRIRYDYRSGEAELAGQVRYTDADEEFSFDRITMNLEKETGVLYNGTIRVRTNNYLLASERIEKTGKQSFSIEKGMLTTCPCDPEPDWKFTLRHAKVTIEDYAYGKDVTFRIRGVPVLWLPWGAFPVKIERQTGFLLPSFSSSHYRGFTLTVPFYWAINRWSDMTVTMNAMTKAGFQPELEYRFVPNPASEGAIRGTYFHDKEAHADRWRAWGANTYNSGEWTVNARWDIPSDNQYYVNLADTEYLRSARQAQATGFVGHSRGNGSEELSATWYRELENPPAQDNTVQRLPEYTANLLPTTIPFVGVDAGGEFQATNFYRRNGDMELRGNVIATLSRSMVLYPSVSMTPYLFVNLLGDRYELPAGGWENAGRFVPGGGATLSIEARKDFPNGGEGHVHVVGTSIGYRYVPDVAQDNIPVTDRWSRIAPQNQFVLTLAQRFLGVKDGGSPRELAALYIEWAYDIGGRVPPASPYVDPLSPFVRTLQDQISTAGGLTPGTDAASDIYGRFALTPGGRWKFLAEALFDPMAGTFVTSAVGGEWKKDDDHRLAAEYRTTQGLAEDVHGLFAWRLARFLKVQAQANYSIKSGYFTDASTGFTVNPRSDCWGVGLTVDRKNQPRDTSVKLTFNLKGIGSVGK